MRIGFSARYPLNKCEMEKVEAKRLSSCEVRIVMLEYKISVSAILKIPLYGKRVREKLLLFFIRLTDI